MRCNTSSQNVPREEYSVSGLDEGAQYQFRVIAKTAINISRPSDVSDPILVSAENGEVFFFMNSLHFSFEYSDTLLYSLYILLFTVPPRIELSIQMKKMVPKKAGSDICLEAEVFGKPMPKVTWSKDGKVLSTDKDMKMSQKRHLFCVNLTAVTKHHTGQYSILAENTSGSKTADIQLTVLGLYYVQLGNLQMAYDVHTKYLH